MRRPPALPAQVKDLLLKLAGYMVVKDMSAKEVFKQFEPQGAMNVATLRALFAMLLPALRGAPELADLLAQYQRMDRVRGVPWPGRGVAAASRFSPASQNPGVAKIRTNPG